MYANSSFFFLNPFLGLFAQHPYFFLFCVAVMVVIISLSVRDWRRLSAAHRYLVAHDEDLKRIIEGTSNSFQRKELYLRSADPVSLGLYHYFGAFSRAADVRSLASFSVENNLGGVRRAAASASGWRRPLAGLMLLFGLVVTLINLQSSVGSLSRGLQNFGVDGHIRATQKPDGALTGTEIEKQHNREAAGGSSQSMQQKADEVRNGMAAVANSASNAFAFGLGFISIALVSMSCASFIEGRARSVVKEIQYFADQAYQVVLPRQSASIDRASLELAQAATGLNSVVSRLGNVATEIANLGPLVAAMSSAAEAIKGAMAQLPTDLQTSMSSISSELVQGMTNTLGGTNDGIKQILQIYGQQQVNIEQVRQHTAAVSEANKQISVSVGQLTTLPDNLAKLQNVIEQNAKGQTTLVKAVERTNQIVQDFPVDELRLALEQEVKTQATFEETSNSIRVLMHDLQVLAAEQKTMAPQIREAIDAASQQVLHMSRVLESFENTSALGLKGAYLAPLAEDTLRKLRELESTSDLRELRQGVVLLRRQIQAARDHALAQAASVGGVQ